MKVPFFRLKFSRSEQKEITGVLRSGWVTTGPRVREFEEKIRKLVGTRYAVGVSSGTAGLHLTLESLRLKKGDQVITTPYTMAATAEAILYSGAMPVFADIDPATLTIDPAQVKKKITGRTRAIMPVDIAGYPCDYDRLHEAVKDLKITLIADAAHSIGAQYRGKPVGSLADATVFSFYSTKNITTGEGGMVVTDSRRLADTVRLLSLHGMTSSGWKRHSGGSWRYDIAELGFKYNLSDLAAAMGLGQLARFEKMQRKRSRLAVRYLRRLKKLADYIETPASGGGLSHAWHLLIVKMTPGRWRIGRDRLITELEKRGVGCGVHFVPVYRFSYFKRSLGIQAADFPASEDSFKRVISLPLFPDLAFAEVDYVCDNLEALVKRYGR
ncbi:MAG: DegT/DnrJ/EryC1/StrS family aminotransferase [Candidatus Zixiibacteriota bacterium]|nr:MAG: DegT/DnrJ/EryC1/StrS family aminotransferase [candidate division Zixibacteria bacterium]